MGAIRGISLVLVCILIFFSFLAIGILWTVSSSLQYENVKENIVSLIGNVVDEQLDIDVELNSLMPVIEEYCETQSQYVFDYGGSQIVIPCDFITQGPSAIVESGVNSLVEEYYYKEYVCDFWNCFEEDDIPLFLISQKAHDYWKSKFYLVLVASLVLAGLAFLLVEKKTNFLILTGGLATIAAFPLVKIGAVTSRLSSTMGNLGEYASEIVLVFFNQSNNVFIKIIIFGVVLLVVGIVLKIFNFGITITNFFRKFSKKSFKMSKIGKEKKPGKVKEKEKKKK